MTDVRQTEGLHPTAWYVAVGNLIPFLMTLITVFVLLAPAARADQHIGDFCRIKGQEENTLHGMGLIVGLRGTGDGDSKATLRALARYMDLMGHRLGTNQQGQPLIEELKNVRNVALVFVTAIVPPGGAQQGDTLDCTVSAISAKSIEGGYLMLTELYGPLPGDKTVYGLGHGPISIDDIVRPQTGRISLGCQVETKFQTEFVHEQGPRVVPDHFVSGEPDQHAARLHPSQL
jgi:flagellar P-ring protein FlgI